MTVVSTVNFVNMIGLFPMDVIITAGGKISDEFASVTGQSVKALLIIGDKPVIDSVIDAVSGLSDVKKIFLIAPKELGETLEADPKIEIIDDTGDGALNFLMGIDRCSGNRVLFVASDLPFITTEALQKFIHLCPSNADFCYPVIRKEQFLSTYPDSPVKFESLRGGCFTGGCAFLVNPTVLQQKRDTIEKVFSYRKSPLKLASLAGWRLILGFLTRTASVEGCAERASKVMGMKCCAVLDSPPELAYDMDDLDDYRYALKISESRNA